MASMTTKLASTIPVPDECFLNSIQRDVTNHLSATFAPFL
jgi:hypothetical protein